MRQFKLIIATLLLIAPFSANADLIVYSDDVIRYDRNNADVTDDLFFYRDLSRFYDMTYDEQIASILLLNTELAGGGDPWADSWRMATGADLAELRAAGGGWIDVLGVFEPFGSTILKGRTDVPAPPDPAHVVWEVYSDTVPPFSQEAYAKDDADRFADIGAWAVASYQTRPVPEPGTLALLGLGLVGMGLSRRRKKI